MLNINLIWIWASNIMMTNGVTSKYSQFSNKGLYSHNDQVKQ